MLVGRISLRFVDGGNVPNSSNEERADGFGVIVDEVVLDSAFVDVSIREGLPERSSASISETFVE